jgi:hypothetical protein
MRVGKQEKNVTKPVTAMARENPASQRTPRGDGSGIEVRRVRDEAEMEDVYRLTHDCFVASGYCTPKPDGRLIHHPHLHGIPQTTVLVAVVNDEIVGTNTWTLDGPAGLHVDRDFRQEVDAIRGEGRILACSYRIVTRVGYRNERSIVTGLIRETLNQFVAIGGQTAVFSFNPKHERVYQRLLNMATIARRTDCRDFNTPLVLMRMDVEKVPEGWIRPRSAQSGLPERGDALIGNVRGS